jgi:hypothetical protein
MSSMRKIFAREVAATGLPTAPSSSAAVTDDDLAGLPEPARRYLRFMGVVGRPRDWSFVANLTGRFRPSAEASWQALDSWQYNAATPDVARLFCMRLRFFGLPVQGRDIYLRGKGSLVIRPLDLFTVQDGRGPEFDLGELVTWLNDAVLFAPSMLLTEGMTWSAVDDGSFDLSFIDRGNAVTARVLVDKRGAVTEFRTNDRWYAPPGSKTPVRTPWTTPVDGWQSVDGRMLPTDARATWKCPEGDLTYGEFHIRPGDIVFNVPPGSTGPTR